MRQIKLKQRPRRRLTPAIRRQQIVSAALKLAAKSNYLYITRDEVAAEAGVSKGLIFRYCGTMDDLKQAVLKAAITEENVAVLAQGLVNRETIAQEAPQGLKDRAAAQLNAA